MLSESNVPSFQRIAVYGKGGIGKSTMSANLSSAFAKSGQKILQIGCDPKKDSTRLLLGGQRVQTVLEYLRQTPPDEQCLDDVLHRPAENITCVEAGGPEPGVGCAGRGILSSFSLLDRLGCPWDGFDTILYDVLGDVVCGGFAVPLRQDHAEQVLIVTSEEFMSIYAANNIMKGVRNMEQGHARSIGILINRRDNNASIDHLYEFSRATGVPILAEMPRSPKFGDAEAEGMALVHKFPDSTEAKILADLTEKLKTCPPCTPSPLSEDELEQMIRGQRISRSHETQHQIQTESLRQERASLLREKKTLTQPKSGKSYLSKSLIVKEPLHGCAFTGAVNTLTQIKDAITIAHGSRSCANIAHSTMIASGLDTLRRHNQMVAEQMRPNLVSTNLNEDKMVHGGMDSLQATLEKYDHPEVKRLFVTTSCPAAVIGDDVGLVLEKYHQQGNSHQTPAQYITTDGNLEGDYLQGLINTFTEVARELIDPQVRAEPDCVNIIGEKNIARNTDSNFELIQFYLEGLGLKINNRFIRACTIDSLKNFKKASLNLLVSEDHLGRTLRTFLQDEFDCKFAQRSLPTGWNATREWIEEIAEHFHRSSAELLSTLQSSVDQSIAQLKPHLEGKSLMIVSYNHDVDYILETALSLGMKVVKIGIVEYSQDNVYRTRYPDQFNVELDYDPNKRAHDILELKPDLFLGNYQSSGLPLTTRYDSIPIFPDCGHLVGYDLAERWMRNLYSPLKEGWREDEELLNV